MPMRYDGICVNSWMNRTKGEMSMKEYEVVHEIFNECANNQMRDIFFEEVALDDPEQYIRSRHKDRELKIEREDLEDGTIVYHVETSGIAQKYTFTEI